MMSLRMFTNTVFTPWLTIPIAGILMLIVGAHIGAIQESDQPASRVRIRVANGWVMLLLLPLLAAGFGVIDPDGRPRLFYLTWTMALGLLMVCVFLAVLDVVNTVRLAQSARRSIARDAAARLADELRAARRQDDGA